MKKVVQLKDGSLKYNNVRIENNPTQSLKEMVSIVKGPSYIKPMLNKKFVTLEKAILAIDNAQAMNMITKGYIDPRCVINITDKSIEII
tara:strand:- start:951 stop:1217 length:267 start_codon:yes stop_codon:yes gene_type:complete